MHVIDWNNGKTDAEESLYRLKYEKKELVFNMHLKYVRYSICQRFWDILQNVLQAVMSDDVLH